MLFCTLIGPANRLRERVPRAHVTHVRDVLGAVGIVEIEQRSLRVHVGAAEARGMLRIAFNLGRTEQVAFDQNRRRVAVERKRGRVVHRAAGNDVLRLLHVRHDLGESASWCSRSCRPAPARRPWSSGIRGARTNRATRKRPWGIRGAASPGILRCRRVLPGCASTRGRWSARVPPSRAARSSWLRFPGQTSGPPCFVFCSSMFIFGECSSRFPSLPLPVAGIATGDVLHGTHFILLLYGRRRARSDPCRSCR